jgi:hypothetical protein
MRQGEQEAAPVIGDQTESLLLYYSDAAGNGFHVAMLSLGRRPRSDKR